MADKVIYFDNASTSIVNHDVLDSYNQVINSYIGNPGSIHFEGQKANRLLEKSRQQILDLLGFKNHKVIFTGSATEANNLALKGYALKYKNRGNHIIVSSVEHPSILETARQLESFFGFEVTYLPVTEKGVVDINELIPSIKDDTILVSVMSVNNETGAINPINEIGEVLKKYPKIVFHTDAVQAIGKVNIDYSNVDMLTFTGHKIHGLLGIGCLIIPKTLDLLPLITGGGQEDNLRSGTNAVALSVSLAKALRLSLESMEQNRQKLYQIASILREFIKINNDKYHLNSFFEENPYIINFSLKEHKAAVVVEGLSTRGIMISSTSACHSKGETGSYVVKAMNDDEWLSHNTLRVSLDEQNTIEEMYEFIKMLSIIERGIKQ